MKTSFEKMKKLNIFSVTKKFDTHLVSKVDEAVIDLIRNMGMINTADPKKYAYAEKIQR